MAVKHSPDTVISDSYDRSKGLIKTANITGVTTTLTWTGTIAISNDNVPDTDTAVDITGAKTVYVQFDTTDATTGVPDFDVDVLASVDGTTYETADYATSFTAQAKNVVDGAAVTVGPAYLKLRLDVNTAELAATETVTAIVYAVF